MSSLADSPGALPTGSAWAGQRVTVMGLGRFSGGVGVARYLARRGAIVTVTDSATADSLADSVAVLRDLPIRFVLGEHRNEDFTTPNWLVVGPGVPKSSPFLRLAVEAGVPTTAEMNLLLAECRGRVVGITGSNGKSTSTAMIGAALATAFRSWTGGNIGRSLLELVDQIEPADRVALEMSSFQLEDLGPSRRSPPVAAVTNLTPNHLDRHGSMAEYGFAKKQIFLHQRPSDWLILNAEDAVTAPWAAEHRGRLAWFATERDDRADGDLWVCVEEPRPHTRGAATVTVAWSGSGEVWSGPLRLQLPGRHNRANAATALAAAAIEGVPMPAAIAALEQFAGLPDRLELVAEVGGVAYYNDSIATTPESVQAALDSFAGGKVCIVGGYNKNLDLAGLADTLYRRAKAVVLIGQAADEIADLLALRVRQAAQRDARADPDDSRQFSGLGPTVGRARDLDQAVDLCSQIAAVGDVVLLSPACASFDMFTNYRHRGEVFRRAVRRLAQGDAPQNPAALGGSR